MTRMLGLLFGSNALSVSRSVPISASVRVGPSPRSTSLASPKSVIFGVP